LAKLIYSRRALDDLERFVDFLLESDPASALDIIDLIEEAVAILKHHPLVGRLIDSDLRELVISRGKTGYVALYSFEEACDTVLILALRHQREAGFETQTDE
jgi:plasmid stabilization system protein ParE